MKIVQPLVTIGIATYNRSESLKQYSLSAIKKLTYPNYEVVIVNDCSTDETQQLLNGYQNQIKNIKVLCNDKNRGLPFSRNKIIENSKGKIIVFVDDDVSLFPDCLDKIVDIYTQDPKVAFIWGCVYQCHGSYDRNEPTFGTGSLFSITRMVADCFRFDTNIRYFQTYGCEEHDFARRVQQSQLKIIKAETAKANHYQAPAKDRAWRGLGGDINYLYEQTKKGSILIYYNCVLYGIIYAIQRIRGNLNVEQTTRQHSYAEAIYSFYRFFVFIKNKNFKIACQYLFYIMIDVPVRCVLKRTVEDKQAYKFSILIKELN